MTASMLETMAVIRKYQPKGFKPRVGMILGSGMASLAEQLTDVVSIPYQAIPGLTGGSGVSGHASVLVMGKLDGIPIVCLRGRLHLYEGVPYESIRTLIRLLKHIGCDIFLSTCAVGSLRENVGPGELVMITDHINFQPGNPMIGPNDASEGPRFFGMDNAYDAELQELMQASADQLAITLHEGVYLSTLGPSFETPAEIRAFKKWGADVVGMSVVPEVIVARHCGLKVVCVAAVTNLAAGMSGEELTHEGTLRYGQLAARKLTKLIPAFIKRVVEN